MGRTALVDSDDLSILNQCTKYLARNGDPATECAEAWRFPLIGPDRGDPADSPDDFFNEVTFVYRTPPRTEPPQAVGVAGTFADLHMVLPLRRVLFLGEPTNYHALTYRVPKAQVHTYQFVVDGRLTPDPINPQRVVQDNGKTWSRFFTDEFREPLVLEPWEVKLLNRLTQHILPFRVPDAENFLKRYYSQSSADRAGTVYHLEESVGETNFIDKLLAREEQHRRVDYRICLEQIVRLLWQRYPGVDPTELSREVFVSLYEDMARNKVEGWDYASYADPKFFLYLLRRHTVTAAFSHPCHGGNVHAAGWAYLSERYTDSTGKTLFDWRPALEKPLGTNDIYR